jgi:hypothetical protein
MDLPKNFALIIIIILVLFSSVSLFLVQFVRGNINSQVVEFEVLPPRNYSIDLVIGVNTTKNWSLISSPLKLINESYKSFTSSVDGNWSLLTTYTNNGSNWLLDDSSGFFVDFENVNFTFGYWIKMRSNETLGVEGINYQDSIRNRTIEIPLVYGWNIIGYPYNYSQNLTIALASIEGKWKSIWRFCNPYCTAAGGLNITGWLSESADNPLPPSMWDIRQLEPGVGYEIYINESSGCTLVYNFTTS